MNKPVKKSVSPSDINRGRYLESLLETALRGGFIDEAAMNKITDELKLFLVYNAIENKTPGLSSVDEKRLDLITGSALYFIGLGLSGLTPDEALEKVMNLDFRSIFEIGKKRGFDLFEKVKFDYHRLKNSLFHTKNAFFIDLIEDTAPTFLENLERFGEGTDALIEFSQADKYFDFMLHVCRYGNELKGIEKVSSYIHALVMENEFLLNFSSSSVAKLNDKSDGLPPVYDPFMGDLDFSDDIGYLPALLCSLKLVIIGKDPRTLELEPSDKEKLSFLLRGKTQLQLLEIYSNALRSLKEFFDLDKEVYEYAEGCLHLIVNA